MSARQRTWARRRAGWLVAAAACLALALDGGYQVYAARVSDRNERTATKVERMSKSSCASTKLLYVLFNALALDSSPRFGSPPEGPIVPGARAKLIAQVFASERASVPRLKAQGCDVRPALP